MPNFRHRWALPQPLPEKADAEDLLLEVKG